MEIKTPTPSISISFDSFSAIPTYSPPSITSSSPSVSSSFNTTPSQSSQKPSFLENSLISKQGQNQTDINEELYESDTLYYYIDSFRQIQGPYNESLMRNWYTKKLLPHDLIVRTSDEKDFVPLSHLVRPFVLSPSVLPSYQKSWYYLDDHGQKQGPFSGELIFSWYHKGYLRPEIKMKSEDQEEFISIGELQKNENFFLSPSALHSSLSHSPSPPDQSEPFETPIDSSSSSSTTCTDSISEPFVEIPSSVEKKPLISDSQNNDPSLYHTNSDQVQPSLPYWCYIDHTGQIQGPFSENTMNEWYKRGLLPQLLQIKPVPPPSTNDLTSNTSENFIVSSTDLNNRSAETMNKSNEQTENPENTDKNIAFGFKPLSSYSPPPLWAQTPPTPPPHIPVVSPIPYDSLWFYLDQDNQTRGPLTWQKLLELQLPPNIMICPHHFINSKRFAPLESILRSFLRPPSFPPSNLQINPEVALPSIPFHMQNSFPTNPNESSIPHSEYTASRYKSQAVFNKRLGYICDKKVAPFIPSLTPADYGPMQGSQEQLKHFFDFEQWQHQKNLERENFEKGFKKKNKRNLESNEIQNTPLTLPITMPYTLPTNPTHHPYHKSLIDGVEAPNSGYDLARVPVGVSGGNLGLLPGLPYPLPPQTHQRKTRKFSKTQTS